MSLPNLIDLPEDARHLRTSASECDADAGALRRRADALTWDGAAGDACRGVLRAHIHALHLVANELNLAAAAVDLHHRACAIAPLAAPGASAVVGTAKILGGLAHAVLP